MTDVTLVREPTILVLAEMHFDRPGLDDLVRWVRRYRPECIDDEGDVLKKLMPHGGLAPDGSPLTDNEMLVELAGRKCYNSFGLKAGKKENADYIANTQQGDIPHASIMYHAKMSFFIGDVSRRVSHELIRNYVGADRDEEGNPSQESTRYTHHPGHFIVHPRTEAGGAESVEQFRQDMQSAYDAYLRYISREVESYRAQHGKDPQQIDRKRIYECAADRLPMACATSWIWTTNPIALAKLFRERANEHADLEFQRFAYKWKALCLRRWPNLFCQPWMRG